MASLFSYVAESHNTFFAFCLIKFQIWSFLSIIVNFEICESSISCKKYPIHLMGDFVILAIFMSPTVDVFFYENHLIFLFNIQENRNNDKDF